MKRLAIEEPFDFHVWIADWSQLTFEFGFFHFHQFRLVLDLCDKSGRLLLIGIEQIVFGEEYFGRVFLYGCLHLHQCFGCFHAFWYLILQNDRWQFYMCAQNMDVN